MNSNSDYATSEMQQVSVTYPKQKSGQKIEVWYEIEETAQSPVFGMNIPDREYEISANVRTSSITGKVEGLEEDEDACDYTIYVKVGGKEYKCQQKRRVEDYYDEEDQASWPYSYDFSNKFFFLLHRVHGALFPVKSMIQYDWGVTLLYWMDFARNRIL